LRLPGAPLHLKEVERWLGSQVATGIISEKDCRRGRGVASHGNALVSPTWWNAAIYGAHRFCSSGVVLFYEMTLARGSRGIAFQPLRIVIILICNEI